jgi:predicted TIM-barrel fold metal-dependent hydrolase
MQMTVLDGSERTSANYAYTGPIFDGDTHMYETEDAWTRCMPKHLKEKFPFEFKRGADGEFALYVGDRKVQISADYMTEDRKIPPPGKLHDWLRAIKEGKSEVDMRVPIVKSMQDPAERVKLLDQWDVRHSVLFIGHMVAALSYFEEEPEAHEIVHGYNQWMLDQWRFNYQDKIYSTPILLLNDLDKACEEARFIIKNGARVAVMPMGPVHCKSPAHPDFDPFWAILNEAKMKVAYHVGEALYMKHHMAQWGEKVQQSRLRQGAFMWMHGYSERPVVETLSSFIFWNFFERFPDMMMMSTENGSEWAPPMLTKMDKVRGMAKNGYWPGGQLKERPSKIFKRHIRVVAYPEDDLRNAIDQTGSAEWLLMGSDYPHSEGVPEPRDFTIERAGQGLTDAELRAVMWENGQEMMAR